MREKLLMATMLGCVLGRCSNSGAQTVTPGVFTAPATGATPVVVAPAPNTAPAPVPTALATPTPISAQPNPFSSPTPSLFPTPLPAPT